MPAVGLGTSNVLGDGLFARRRGKYQLIQREGMVPTQGLEPRTPGSTIRCSNQLSYVGTWGLVYSPVSEFSRTSERFSDRGCIH